MLVALTHLLLSPNSSYPAIMQLHPSIVVETLFFSYHSNGSVSFIRTCRACQHGSPEYCSTQLMRSYLHFEVQLRVFTELHFSGDEPLFFSNLQAVY